jgi:hypothetical protein
MLSSSTLRYTTGMERVVNSISEQAAGSQQLGLVVSEIRSRTRELSAAINSQAKGAHAGELDELVAEVQKLRSAYLSNAEALGELSFELSQADRIPASQPASQAAPSQSPASQTPASQGPASQSAGAQMMPPPIVAASTSSAERA